MGGGCCALVSLLSAAQRPPISPRQLVNHNSCWPSRCVQAATGAAGGVAPSPNREDLGVQGAKGAQGRGGRVSRAAAKGRLRHRAFQELLRLAIQATLRPQCCSPHGGDRATGDPPDTQRSCAARGPAASLQGPHGAHASAGRPLCPLAQRRRPRPHGGAWCSAAGCADLRKRKAAVQ